MDLKHDRESGNYWLVVAHEVTANAWVKVINHRDAATIVEAIKEIRQQIICDTRRIHPITKGRPEMVEIRTDPGKEFINDEVKTALALTLPFENNRAHSTLPKTKKERLATRCYQTHTQRYW